MLKKPLKKILYAALHILTCGEKKSDLKNTILFSDISVAKAQVCFP